MGEATLKSVNLRIIDAVTIGVLGFYSEMEDYCLESNRTKRDRRRVMKNIKHKLDKYKS